MYTFLIAVHAIASVVLILVILLQAGRGGGLTDTFGGSAVQHAFGAKGADFMTKLTTVFVVIFLTTSLSLAVLSSRRGKSLMATQAAIQLQEAAKQASKEAKEAEDAAKAAEEAEKTVTVREVKVDPVTGEEKVVKEEKLTPEEAAAREAQPVTVE